MPNFAFRTGANVGAGALTHKACSNKRDREPGRERRGFTAGAHAVTARAQLSPDALARACADAMWREDRASQGLGMEIVDIGPGLSLIHI